MNDEAYEQLLNDIHDGDYLSAEWKYEYPRKGRTRDQQRDMDILAADLSFMRAKKHQHEVKMVADVTGAALPEYDSAALTKPFGDKIRLQMERLRDARLVEVAWPTG